MQRDETKEAEVEQAVTRLKTLCNYFSDGQANFHRTLHAESNKEPAAIKVELRFNQHMPPEVRTGMVSAVGLLLLNFRRLMDEYANYCADTEKYLNASL